MPSVPKEVSSVPSELSMITLATLSTSPTTTIWPLDSSATPVAPLYPAMGMIPPTVTLRDETPGRVFSKFGSSVPLAW
jgi:hypothetical protein